jgi:hypothetical protein
MDRSHFHLYVLAMVLAAPPSTAADIGHDPVVRSIRDRTREIAAKEKSFHKRVQVVEECSEEGGKLLALREGPKVRKIVFRSFGESGRAVDEYYFDDDTLYFAHRVEERYDRPLSGVVAETFEDRLYFDRGALHLWVRGKATTPVPMSEWAEKARRVQQDASAVLAGAQLDAKTLRCTSQGSSTLQASE